MVLEEHRQGIALAQLERRPMHFGAAAEEVGITLLPVLARKPTLDCVSHRSGDVKSFRCPQYMLHFPHQLLAHAVARFAARRRALSL